MKARGDGSRRWAPFPRRKGVGPVVKVGPRECTGAAAGGKPWPKGGPKGILRHVLPDGSKVLYGYVPMYKKPRAKILTVSKLYGPALSLNWKK